MNIKLKTLHDIEMLKISGRILSELLAYLRGELKEGITLITLDTRAGQFLEKMNVRSAFRGYRPEGAKKPYSAHICISVNDCVVHGIPNEYRVKNGDIVAIDAGVNYKGYITDAAYTIGVGTISETAKNLITCTRKALEEGIQKAKLGNCLGDIGWAIETTVKQSGFQVIKTLTGHGVGFALHEEPTVWNYGAKGQGMPLKEGLVIAIEPITSISTETVRQTANESYVTTDGSLSAHFEQTVVVTENGPEILTPFSFYV